jgi:hypothetical protein
VSGANELVERLVTVTKRFAYYMHIVLLCDIWIQVPIVKERTLALSG